MKKISRAKHRARRVIGCPFLQWFPRLIYFLMSNLRCSSNQSCKMRWRVRWRNIAARSWPTLEEAVDNILHRMKRILMRFMRLYPSGFVWTLSIPKFGRFSGYHHVPQQAPHLGYPVYHTPFLRHRQVCHTPWSTEGPSVGSAPCCLAMDRGRSS